MATPPVIDGKADDPAWSQATEYTTIDKIAHIPITFKIVYTDTDIFVLASYPDENESKTHKSWKWDPKQEIYVIGPDREDTLVLKWNMEPEPVDLSINGDDEYTADIWFWKACRTNPAWYADDKFQQHNEEKHRKAQMVTTATGRAMYLMRKSDAGDSAFKDTRYIEHEENTMPRFTHQTPTGSVADIKAKGVWADGRWTIELGRALITGHDDDVQFDARNNYYFGISRYEISGWKETAKADQPLYNAGDISELLTLRFGPGAAEPPEETMTEPEPQEPISNE